VLREPSGSQDSKSGRKKNTGGRGIIERRAVVLVPAARLGRFTLQLQRDPPCYQRKKKKPKVFLSKEPVGGTDLRRGKTQRAIRGRKGGVRYPPPHPVGLQ